MPNSDSDSSRGRSDIVELLIAVVLIGALVAIVIPRYVNMQQARSKRADVKANCYTVQLAAEDFSVRNNGVYPVTIKDVLPSGTTFTELLPGGELLENPFTEKRTEPSAHYGVGVTLYTPIDKDKDGVYDGYSITGYDGGGVTIITLTSGE